MKTNFPLIRNIEKKIFSKKKRFYGKNKFLIIVDQMGLPWKVGEKVDH